MAWGFEVDGSDIPGILAALGFLAFAAWVFILDPGSRLHRAFAVLMFLRGGLILSIRLGEYVHSLPGRTAGYFEVALPFAALYFALAYRDKIAIGRKVRGPTAQQALPYVLILAVLSEILYLRNHSLLNEGPFLASFGLSYLAFGFFAWMLARQATAKKEGAITRKAAILGSFGFAFEAAYQATWQFSESATEILGGHPDRAQYFLWFIIVSQLGYIAASTFSLLAAAQILRHGVMFTAGQRWAFALPIFGAATLAIPFAVTFALQLIARDPAGVLRWIEVHRFTGGLAALGSLLVIAYAVLRHRLPNMQWKLRLAVRGTTLAGVFFAVLFTLSEGIQVVFERRASASGLDDEVSSIVSVIGAGIVVFFLHPVQRFAERLASRTVPNAKPIKQMSHPERANIYREQAELAWLDGELRRKERLLLDGLRHRLGLAIEEAAKLESDAMRATGGIGFQNRSLGPPPSTRKRRASPRS
jgi:hypothetical protein